MPGAGRSPSTGNVADAEERFGFRAEQLAVRLRWISIAAIPVLACASDQRVSHPAFEIVFLTTVVYDFAVARSEEEQRRRLASELHDRSDRQDSVAASRRLRDIVQPGQVSAREEVDGLTAVVEESVRDLRTMLADLRPRLLDDPGLVEALRDLLARERALSDFELSLEVSGVEAPQGQSALALYRVTQEALTNVRRHAHAQRASVSFGGENGSWKLQVEDDGVGINGTSPEGLGLRTMRERVESLGGSLRIDAEPGRGTRIVAEVPRESS